jgi:hypothetical protein
VRQRTLQVRLGCVKVVFRHVTMYKLFIIVHLKVR